MKSEVDFNMVVEMNDLLKKHQIEYSVHTVGGCSSCGLSLKQDGEAYPYNQIIYILNEYLATKWLKILTNNHDPYMLYIESKFEK